MTTEPNNPRDAALWIIAEGHDTLANVLAVRSVSADRMSLDDDETPSGAARYEGRANAYDRSAALVMHTADALVARFVKCGDNANSEEAADAFERAARIVAEMLGTTAAPVGPQR